MAAAAHRLPGSSWQLPVVKPRTRQAAAQDIAMLLNPTPHCPGPLGAPAPSSAQTSTRRSVSFPSGHRSYASRFGSAVQIALAYEVKQPEIKKSLPSSSLKESVPGG